MRIDTTAPTLTTTATARDAGLVGIGQTVTFAVAVSKALTITGGTPTLALNNGGTATYNAALSTATNLIFDYTVAAGQNTTDLAITGAALNGAVITDPAGNASTLSAAIGALPNVLQIDGVVPVIASVSTLPGAGVFGIGQSIVFTLASTAPITVAGGTPTLTLNDGGMAVYDAAASTPINLVFNYTVVAGQNTADLTVTAAAANGATLTDAGGNALNLAGAIVNPAGILQIKTGAPAITSVTVSPGTGRVGVGQVITFTESGTDVVTITGGLPSLILNDGGIATYDAADSTPTDLIFKYTVAAGQNTADLAIIAAATNGAIIRDAAGNVTGNAADLSGAVGSLPGILQIDTTPPTIATATTSIPAGLIGIGQVLTFTVAASEALTLTGGPPSLTLNNGGTALYDAAASTPTSLVFAYTVAAGQNTTDLAVTAVALNGATIVDPAGNATDLSGAVGNPAGVLQVDATVPTLSVIAAAPTTGNTGIGQVISFTLAASTPLTITGGVPSLTLDNGGTAIYDAADSTPISLAFTYVVAAGQSTADLAISAVALNGATVTDAAGNAADLSGLTGALPGGLQIYGAPPAVTGVTTSVGTGTLGSGQAVVLAVATSAPVTVAGGTPTLTLNDGGTAIYDAAASTPTSLVFDYIVASGQNTADLAVTAFAANGATLNDAGGNTADLTGAIVNPAGVLQVDTTAPTIAAVTASAAAASAGVGQVVTFTITPSKAVTVAGGTPSLTLNDGGTATYDAAASTATSLVFTYTVAATQNTAALTVIGVAMNGATVTDAAGNAAALGTIIGTAPGAVQVDTTAPVVAAITVSPSTGQSGIGRVVTFTVTPSEAVTVTGGIPSFTLNDGGTATYNAAASTARRLAFTYTVANGQETAGLAVIAVAFNGAAITDAAGNAADLAGAVGAAAGALQVNGTPPTISGVTMSPIATTLTPGQTITIGLATTEAVTVANGTPTLGLSNGGTATYAAAASTANTLGFTYTVGPTDPIPGQTTGDLRVTSSALNGATITDAAGNPVDLTNATGAPATPDFFSVHLPRTNGAFDTAGQVYSGPVSGLGHEYINLTSENLNITPLVANVFVETGSGDDAIDVSGVNGNNVLNGNTGSNFLVGGTGSDTFFVDDRAATADIWSSVANFHAGDTATLYGVTAGGFDLDWEDGQGAAGYTGLTLHALAAAQPTASLTLVGYSLSDLSNGRLSMTFGFDPASQSNYMNIQAN